jgi:uncharacterized ParB-like nuclease family protein
MNNTLNAHDHAMIAALLHQRIKPLRPLENPEHIEAFNAYRGLAAKLAVVLEDDDGAWGQFNPLKFISYVMTGESE